MACSNEFKKRDENADAEDDDDCSLLAMTAVGPRERLAMEVITAMPRKILERAMVV